MVFKQAVDPTKKGKLYLNWEGPYKVCHKSSQGAYKLESLEGNEVPKTWNIMNLRHYFS